MMLLETSPTAPAVTPDDVIWAVARAIADRQGEGGPASEGAIDQAVPLAIVALRAVTGYVAVLLEAVATEWVLETPEGSAAVPKRP